MTLQFWPGHRLGQAPRGEVRRPGAYRRMPRISSFYGIAIYMYWNEGQHRRPHFHARYAGRGASIALDGELISGSIPRRVLALVRQWATLRSDELAANWERARRGESLEPIDPLA